MAVRRARQGGRGPTRQGLRLTRLRHRWRATGTPAGQAAPATALRRASAGSCWPARAGCRRRFRPEQSQRAPLQPGAAAVLLAYRAHAAARQARTAAARAAARTLRALAAMPCVRREAQGASPPEPRARALFPTQATRSRPRAARHRCSSAAAAAAAAAGWRCSAPAAAPQRRESTSRQRDERAPRGRARGAATLAVHSGIRCVRRGGAKARGARRRCLRHVTSRGAVTQQRISTRAIPRVRQQWRRQR